MRRLLRLGGWPILFTTALLSGCGLSGGSLMGPGVPGLPPSAFDTAPHFLEASGVRYDVQVMLWRDFMPLSPPEGRGLSAAVIIRAPAGKTIPPGLRPLWIWVRNKNEVWGAQLDQQPGTPPDEIRLSAGNGPRWGPGIEVDVALGRPDVAGGTVQVSILGVPITKTE